jgi:hypothetical protein
MRLEPLIDRVGETARLGEAWRAATSRQAQLAVVWGRRRVGKTFLLGHFVKGKRAVFFSATQQSESVELARLLECVRRDLGARVADLAGGSFTSWESALRFLSALAAEAPLAVVLDEVPYLARSTPGFPSIVQAVWDHLPAGTRLLLVLTGSAVGTIESMLGAGGALRGRPTVPMRLDPLDPWSARAFLPGLAPAAFFEAYAACGGYPLHLRAWDETLTARENLLKLAATPGAILLEDALGMLREELPEAGGYGRILGAIGRGRTRYSDIAGEAGQRIQHPLDVLVSAGFVEKCLPIGAPKAARPVYEILDPYLGFWFRVLYSDQGLIAGGQGPAVLGRVLPRWQHHVGRVFEEAARSHALRQVAAGRLPPDLIVGRWWAASGEPCEVDVLGLRGSRSVLLGEAKWQAHPLGLRELESLRRKATRVPSVVDEPMVALWAREGVEAAVRRSGALGYSAADMLAG